MSDDMQRHDGETNVEFAARLRDTASRIHAWGGDEERARLLARADRVERGEE
ncbi:hypothetical protein [Amycolatopsis sp. NPDC049159]|uniref:hypothetical protein n=1 Tax=Amycolatopsis sp. NPDC049159 TaxID=3157210 RepID=UPI0033EC0B8E